MRGSVWEKSEALGTLTNMNVPRAHFLAQKGQLHAPKAGSDQRSVVSRNTHPCLTDPRCRQDNMKSSLHGEK